MRGLIGRRYPIRAFRLRRLRFTRVPGNEVTDDLGHVAPVRIAAGSFAEGMPESRLEPEGVAGVAFGWHEVPFCRDTLNSTWGLRCRDTRDRLGVMTPRAATHTAKCLRCGRTRTFRTPEAAKAAGGYGRVCAMRVRLAAAAEAVKGFAAAQVEKARELIADGGLIPVRTGVFRAVSSKGDATYLTHPQTCSCAAAKRGRATPCYHSLAARLIVASGKAA